MRTISKARQEDTGHFKPEKIVFRELPKQLEPSNVHFEVYMHTKTTRIKLEEWSFITHKTLLKSINCEDDDSDPELDNIEIQHENFFLILSKLLGNVTPRLLIKLLEPHTLEFMLVTKDQDLVPFDGENTFVIKVGDFESNNFECSVSLKYNYEFDNDDESEEYASEGNDSCEFELLVDPVF